MQKKNRVTLWGIVMIFLLACACPATSLPIIEDEAPTAVSFPTAQPFPTIPVTSIAPPTAVPETTTDSELYFSDDFSVPSVEMEAYADENGSTETLNGVYVLRAISDLWYWGESASKFDNVVVEVDVTLISGPSNDNAGFGVVCRLSTREDTSIDGYMLAITADGYYTIRSITSSSMSPLVDYSFSSIINQGNATNRMRVTCNGSDLILEVNGETLATANTIADGSASGSIAFSGISYESDNRFVEVHFDNLVVSKP